MTEETFGKLNKALKQNAELQTFIGIDSSRHEIEMVHRKQYQNLLFLKEEDPEKFDILTKDFKRYRVFMENETEWRPKRKIRIG